MTRALLSACDRPAGACCMLSAGWAASARAVAVFDFELIDTSLEGEMSGPRADEQARLARASEQLRQRLAESGRFPLVDIAPVAAAGARQQSAGLRRLRRAARRAQVGAELAITGTVQKVSNLILNMTHLRSRRRDRTPGRRHECRFPRQYRRVLVARARLAGAQPPARARIRSGADDLVPRERHRPGGGRDRARARRRHHRPEGRRRTARSARCAPDVVRATVAAIAGRRPVSAVDRRPADGAGRASSRPSTRWRRPASTTSRSGCFPVRRREACIRALAALGAQDQDRRRDVRRSAAPTLRCCPLMAAVRLCRRDARYRRARERAACSTASTSRRLRDFVAACRAARICWPGSPARWSRPTSRACCCSSRTFSASAARSARAAIAPPRSTPHAVGLVRGLIPLDPRSAASPGSGGAEGRLSAARGARLFGRARQGRRRPTASSCAISCCRSASAPMRTSARSRSASASMSTSACCAPAIAVEDMRDVFSYDMVTDGIRMLVAHEHFALRRDAGRTDRRAGAGAPAGRQRDGAGREARGRAGRGRRRDHARAPGRRRQGASALSGRGGGERSESRRECAVATSPSSSWAAALPSRRI